MASKRTRTTSEEEDGFKCSICEKKFKFLSKYTRHLESSDHTRFEQSLKVDIECQDADEGVRIAVDASALPSTSQTSQFTAEEEESSQVITLI